MGNLIGKPQFNKRKLIYGVGVNDYPDTTKINGFEIKEYRVWKDMLKRCFSESYRSKNQCYDDVSCCPSWLLFSNFLKDVSDKENAFADGFHLDKDVLGSGKIYDKESVCFLPQEINVKLGSFSRKNTKYGLGVRFLDGKYCVRYTDSLCEVNLGRYLTLDEAQKVSVDYRKSVLDKLIDKFKAELSPLIISSLRDFSEITFKVK